MTAAGARTDRRRERAVRGGFRVVVAGRPNVGKSALFNRLIRRRKSLVHDLPGMTRDVLEETAELPDGRRCTLLDTGGFDPEGREPIPAAVREKAAEAIRRANLVLLVIDASAGVLPGDRSAARLAREAGVETLVVANKVDRRDGRDKVIGLRWNPDRNDYGLLFWWEKRGQCHVSP